MDFNCATSISKGFENHSDIVEINKDFAELEVKLSREYRDISEKCSLIRKCIDNAELKLEECQNYFLIYRYSPIELAKILLSSIGIYKSTSEIILLDRDIEKINNYSKAYVWNSYINKLSELLKKYNRDNEEYKYNQNNVQPVCIKTENNTLNTIIVNDIDNSINNTKSEVINDIDNTVIEIDNTCNLIINNKTIHKTIKNKKIKNINKNDSINVYSFLEKEELKSNNKTKNENNEELDLDNKKLYKRGQYLGPQKRKENARNTYESILRNKIYSYATQLKLINESAFINSVVDDILKAPDMNRRTLNNYLPLDYKRNVFSQICAKISKDNHLKIRVESHSGGQIKIYE